MYSSSYCRRYLKCLASFVSGKCGGLSAKVRWATWKFVRLFNAKRAVFLCHLFWFDLPKFLSFFVFCLKKQIYHFQNLGQHRQVKGRVHGDSFSFFCRKLPLPVSSCQGLSWCCFSNWPKCSDCFFPSMTYEASVSLILKRKDSLRSHLSDGRSGAKVKLCAHRASER